MLKTFALLTLAAFTLTACTGSTPPSGSLVTVTDASGQTFTYHTGTYQVARTPLPTAPWTDAEQTLLTLVNAARANGGTCPTTTGQTQVYPPSPPLTFEAHLQDAALQYAQVLAHQDQFNTLSHTGPDGSLPAGRMIASGYTPTVTNAHPLILQESLAAMQPYDAPQIITAWQNSPAHCPTIYSASAEDVGLGLATAASGSTYVVLDVGGQ